MADDLFHKLLNLREASFDLNHQSRLLNFVPQAKFQTPLMSEDGIAFLEKWMRKPVALPLSLFAPVTAAFSDTSQSNLFADIRYAIRSLEEGTGEQNAFLCIGFLKSQGLAPLLLVPVQIDTKNLTVSLSATPPIENIPLRVKNKETLKFPVAKNFVIGGTFQIRNYFDAVQEAIVPFPEWRSTSRGLFIGFYDSASLYAFNDMESESWKQFDLTGHLLSQLLSSEGFHVVESDLDSSNPNDIFNPTEHFFTHILDSEANTALLESLSPANDLCVVETPPGSSGEEFLANYISESVSTGKKVLLTYKRKTSFARFEKTWNPQSPEYKDTTLEKAREALSQARAAVVNYDKAINQPIPIGGCSLADALAALAQNTNRKKNWSDSTFSGSENLSKEQFHSAQSNLQDLLEILDRDNSQKALKAYDGGLLDSTNELQKKRLAEKLKRANEEFSTLSTLAESVSNVLFFNQNIDIQTLSDLGNAISPDFNNSTPSFDGWALESKDWTTFKDSLQALPNAGTIWSEFRRTGSPIYVDGAIDMQLGVAREILKDNLDRTFKAFSEYYHNARKILLRTLKDPKQGRNDADLLALTDKLIQLQDSKKLYTNTSALAGRLFGKDWQFEHTNWIVLDAKIRWFYNFRQKAEKSENASLAYAILSKYSQIKNQISDAQALRELCRQAQEDFDDLCREFQFQKADDFKSVTEQAELLQKWEAALPLLPIFTQIQSKRKELREQKLDELDKAIISSHPGKEFLAAEFSRFWHSLQIQRACNIFPELFSSTPKIHTKHARDFREASDDLCTMNLRFAKNVVQKNPKLLTILPIGQVASNLPKEARQFDVAVILDAEAIPPNQAIPALLRSQRAILFGDSNLPTPPFPNVLGEERQPPFIASQFESVISYSLYKGAKLSFLALNRLHKHPILIDYANQNIYNQKIKKLPPPNAEIPNDIQVSMVQDTSLAIADAAAKHVEQHPMQSLGIIVFTEERRKSVFQAIQKKIHEHPDLGFFLSPKDALRDPYVRLPEEASGNFRDVLFICAEPVAAIANQGFNAKSVHVCATHALSCLRIFTSEPFEKSSSANAGVRAYADFLSFVQTAKEIPLFKANPLLATLEEHIFQNLDSDQCQIEKNWGYNGASIQFAVHDSNNPEHFLLGVETDSSNGYLRESVEDRLYLRNKILEHLGWKIIRLWCPNWFRSTHDECEHVLTTIAVEQSVAPPPREKSREEEEPEFHVEPYKIINPKIEGSVHDVPIPELAAKLLILQMKFYIDAESPIHEKSLIRRVLHLHGLHRAGPVVVRAIKNAIVQGLAKKAFIKTGQFFYTTNNKPVVLRDRSALPEEERKLVFVSPEEKELFPPGTDEQTIKETLGLL